MGTQNFDFALKFSQIGVSVPNFAFLDENLFRQDFVTIFRQPKI